MKCDATNKVRYKTSRAAASASYALGVYPCRACGGWHRTSHPWAQAVAHAKAARLPEHRIPKGPHGTKIGDVWPT